VAVRNHISTLKHTIRQQQAQLHNLENIVLRGPRPYPAGIMPSSSSSSTLHSPNTSTIELTPSESTAPSSFAHHHGQAPSSPPSHRESTSSSSKGMRRRSSFDILHNIAPDSSLPLPRRESMRPEGGGIREGVPMEFGAAPVNMGHHKRVSSPTRTYSRTSLILNFLCY
jgi:hypothetical protein